MSITADLEQILSARYGEEVRQAIHDSIEAGYNIAVQAQGTAETSAESAEAYAAAALASEQAAQGYKELAEQYKDEAFSGTPTGYADLVAKVNSIYKQTVSSFGVVGTVEGLALAHTIYGMSVQDGTPTPSVPVDIDSAVANFKCVGKNVLSYPYNNTTKTTNGVTFTDNGDGTISTSGTASADAIFAFHTRGQGEDNDLVLPNGNYIGSGCPSSGSSAKYYIGYGRTHNGVFQSLGDDTGTGLNLTLNGDDFSDDSVNIQIAITIKSGINADGLTFYPMITLADADQTWEEYKSKTIATDLTLRAIEVPSSADYNLVKDGKYYIADTLDWSEDDGYSITRRVAYEQATTCFYYADKGNDVAQINIHLTEGAKYVSQFLSNGFVFGATAVNGNAYIDNNNEVLVLFIEDSSITSTATGTTWLTNNPTYIEYVLDTPTSESVTSAQAQVLLGLKTYDEATSIDGTGDVAPSVTLEYSKDRATALGLMSHNMAHINSLKIADLS